MQPLWRVGAERTWHATAQPEAGGERALRAAVRHRRDALYSVGEIACTASAVHLAARAGANPRRRGGRHGGDKVVFFAIFAAFSAVHRRKAARIHYLRSAGACRGLDAGVELAHLYPFDQEPSLRALLAVLVAAGAQGGFFKEEAAPHRKVCWVLWFSAGAAFATYCTSARCSSRRRQGRNTLVNTAPCAMISDGEIFPRAAL